MSGIWVLSQDKQTLVQAQHLCVRHARSSDFKDGADETMEWIVSYWTPDGFRQKALGYYPSREHATEVLQLVLSSLHGCWMGGGPPQPYEMPSPDDRLLNERVSCQKEDE